MRKGKRKRLEELEKEAAQLRCMIKDLRKLWLTFYDTGEVHQYTSGYPRPPVKLVRFRKQNRLLQWSKGEEA